MKQSTQIIANESITVTKSIIQDTSPAVPSLPWFKTYLSYNNTNSMQQHWLYEIHQARYESPATLQTTPELAKALIASASAPTQLPSTLIAYNDYNFILSDAASYSKPAPTPKQPEQLLAARPTDQHATQTKRQVYGYVEGNVVIGYLTNGYGNWFNQSLKSYTQVDKKNGVALQLAHDYEYHEYGDYAVGNLLHIFNEEWYADVGTGVSNKSIFVPRYYIGATAFHKMASRRQLVTYLGVHTYWWRPIYATQDINPGFIYYFEKSWILEIGGLGNRSNPGAVYSASAYVAVTQGRDKEHLITLRGGFGKEAYLPLGASSLGVVGYTSNVLTCTWRQWWGKNVGTNLIGEFYNNPFYNRYGITVGLFVDFAT